MNKYSLMTTALLGMLPSAAFAAAYEQHFTFATPEDIAIWDITVNHEDLGPGVPEYDGDLVRIAPDLVADPTGATKSTGGIYFVTEITAPAGEAFTDMVFSGIVRGYASHVTWAEIRISTDGTHFYGGTINPAVSVVQPSGKAWQGYDDVAVTVIGNTADPDAFPDMAGPVESVFLAFRIVDALGILSQASASPHLYGLTFTAETVPVPEPTSIASLAIGSSMLLVRRRK